jgi:hypothetical protein
VAKYGQINKLTNLESSNPKIIQPELGILNISNSPLFHCEIKIMVLLPPPQHH